MRDYLGLVGIVCIIGLAVFMFSRVNRLADDGAPVYDAYYVYDVPYVYYVSYLPSLAGGARASAPVLPTLPLEHAQVVAGRGISAVIMPDGALWKWGNGFAPTQVGQGYVQAVALFGNLFALSADGELHWFFPDASESEITPTTLRGGVVYIAASNQHILAIDADGALWARGAWAGPDWHDGQHILDDVVTAAGYAAQFAVTADGDLVHIFAHTHMTVMHNVAAFSASRHHLAITTDGILYAWGYNSMGQLGDGTQQPRTTRHVRVMENVAYVVAGAYNSMLITDCGQLWGWGDNRFGQIDHGWENDFLSEPRFILDGVAHVALSANHVVAAMLDGRILTWGANTQGEVGDGLAPMTRFAPHEIDLTLERGGGDVGLAQVMVAFDDFMAAAAGHVHITDMQVFTFIGAPLPMMAVVMDDYGFFVLSYRGGWNQIVYSNLWDWGQVFVAVNAQGLAYIVHYLYDSWHSTAHYRFTVYYNGFWVNALTFNISVSTRHVDEWVENAMLQTALEQLEIVELWRGDWLG